MSEYIPLEIQVEILKMLPIKSVIQFRSVSKQWKRLIDSSEFVVSYGVRHPQPHRLLLRYIDDVDFKQRYFTFVDDFDHTFAKQEFAPTVSDLINGLEYSRVVGSSHGLFCLYGYYRPPNDDYNNDTTNMVVLWNPSIRQSVGIEVPYDDWSHDIRMRFGVDSVVGFGVCPVTVDPIILYISYVCRWKTKDKSGTSLSWRVQLFSLSIGTWDILSTNLPLESVRLRGNDQVIIDRFIYWVACDDENENENGEFRKRFLLISFNLTSREFCAIDLPDHLAFDHLTLNISKLRNSLVVLEYTTVWSVWMMVMRQGVTQSFERLFTINLPDKTINALLAFRKTGEPILETQERDQRCAAVEIYEPCSQHIDDLGIYGEDGFFYVGSYMESLFLLDQSDGYIYSISN